MDDERLGFVQIARNFKHKMYLIVFDCIKERGEAFNLGEIVTSNILFASISTDAKIWHAHWPLVGNTQENLPHVQYPLVKVETENGVQVGDIDKNVVSAEGVDVEKLNYRTSVSPIRLEKALKGYLGLIDWDDDYEMLRYQF